MGARYSVPAVISFEDFKGDHKPPSGVSILGESAEVISALSVQARVEPVPIKSEEISEGAGNWILPIMHLSATQLNMLSVCPRQWQQRYLLGRKEPPGQARVLGQIFHKTQERNYEQKILSHEDMDMKELVDLYYDSLWPDCIDEIGGYEEIVWDHKPELVRDLGGVMVSTYLRDTAPLVQPLAAEQAFEVEVPGVPVPVVGVVDLEEDWAITDMKTSGKKLSKPKPAWRLQGRLYQLQTAKPVGFHVVTKGKQPAVVTVSQSASLSFAYSEHAAVETQTFVRQLAWLANDLYRKYGPDQDWPTLGLLHDWRCDWCGYKAGCPAWRV